MRQFSHVDRVGNVLYILQSVRAVELGACHTIFLRVQVHFLEEVFRVIRVVIKLKGPNARDVVRCVLLSEKFEPKVLRERKSSIITRWQHQA